MAEGKKSKVTTEFTEIELRSKVFHSKFPELLKSYELGEDPYVALNKFNKMVSGCEDCLLCLNRNQVVLADGTPDAEIMIILESPGFLENLVRIPLVGTNELLNSPCNQCLNVFKCFDSRVSFIPGRRPTGRKREVECKPEYASEKMIQKTPHIYSSGNILDGLLFEKYRGVFPRHNWIFPEYPYKSPWFITNAALCRSWNIQTLRDEPPPNRALNQCKKHLATQFSIVNPKVIVTMGRSALQTLIGEQKSKSVGFGEVLDTKFGPVIHSLHPAAIMRDRDPDRAALGYAKIGKILDKALMLAGLIKDGELCPIEK